jgi:membrane-associated phospholipid phosphatase
VAELLQTILALDSAASSFGEDVRWAPLTVVFLLASAWWVKWPLMLALGSACDAKRKCFPRAAVAATLAVTSAAILVTLLKDVVERGRPPASDPGLDPIGVVPASSSFPSGHAATAFAAAVAVALIYPRLGRPLLALAVVVAISRVYLGVHFLLDVTVGALLGIALGYAAAWIVRAVAPVRPSSAAPAPGASS